MEKSFFDYGFVCGSGYSSMKKKIFGVCLLFITIVIFKIMKPTSNNYCKDVYQYFGNKTIVYASDAKDYGSYYEMTASISCGVTEDGSLTESVNVVVRVSKNATVFFLDDPDTKLNLYEYANWYSDTITELQSARMFTVTQDNEGYIVSFGDSHAG